MNFIWCWCPSENLLRLGNCAKGKLMIFLMCTRMFELYGRTLQQLSLHEMSSAVEGWLTCKLLMHCGSKCIIAVPTSFDFLHAHSVHETCFWHDDIVHSSQEIYTQSLQLSSNVCARIFCRNRPVYLFAEKIRSSAFWRGPAWLKYFFLQELSLCLRIPVDTLNEYLVISNQNTSLNYLESEETIN